MDDQTSEGTTADDPGAQTPPTTHTTEDFKPFFDELGEHMRQRRKEKAREWRRRGWPDAWMDPTTEIILLLVGGDCQPERDVEREPAFFPLRGCRVGEPHDPFLGGVHAHEV
jgi:hypothetical protein